MSLDPADIDHTSKSKSDPVATAKQSRPSVLVAATYLDRTLHSPPGCSNANLQSPRARSRDAPSDLDQLAQDRHNRGRKIVKQVHVQATEALIRIIRGFQPSLSLAENVKPNTEKAEATRRWRWQRRRADRPSSQDSQGAGAFDIDTAHRQVGDMQRFGLD